MWLLVLEKHKIPVSLLDTVLADIRATVMSQPITGGSIGLPPASMRSKSGGCSGSWRAGRRAQSSLAMYSPATEAATSTRAFRENTPAFASFPLAAL